MSSRTVYGGIARRSIGVFSPWVVSATAYALGSVTAGLASLGIVLLGYADIPALGPADLVQMVSTRTVMTDEVVVFAVTQGLAILVQAMWISSRGKHPFLAPTLSLVIGWMVAVIVAPFSVAPTPLLLITALAQVLTLAAMIGRTRPGR